MAVTMPPRDSLAAPSLDSLRDALTAHGLILRNGFHPTENDGTPPNTGTVLMIGNAGPEMWRAFNIARPTGKDPLNNWTRHVLQSIAVQFGATALFPFDGPPYHPFQRWAAQAETVHESPLGILLHPDYGLWHAWRGALCFLERFELPRRGIGASPCEGCRNRPCLSACPVSAFGPSGYDTSACAAWLRSPGGAECLSRGCIARHACPVGPAYAYLPDQAALHMNAFLNGQHDTGLRLRDYRSSDASEIGQLFYDSVHRAAAAEYTPVQRAAWAPDIPDPAALHTRMASCQTIIAEGQGNIAGFTNLQKDGRIDMLYVHADRQRQGVGALLYRRIEGIARSDRYKSLSADVSVTARPFFEENGFTVIARQTVSRGGINLTNYAMEKRLTP